MIKIYTFQFNNPEFLHYQFLTFKRFIKAEHELIGDKKDRTAFINLQEIKIENFLKQ